MQKIGPMSLGNEFDDYYLKSAGHSQQFYIYSAEALKLHFSNTEAYLLSSTIVNHTQSEEKQTITSTLSPVPTSTQTLHTNMGIANDQTKASVRRKNPSIFNEITGTETTNTSTLSTNELWGNVMQALSGLGVGENINGNILRLAQSIKHKYKLNENDSAIDMAKLVRDLKQVVDGNHSSSSSQSSSESLFCALLDKLKDKFSPQSVDLVRGLLIDMHEICEKNLHNRYKMQ